MIMKKDLYRAVDLNCKNCIYDPLAGGTWREQVERCTVKTCAMFFFRPTSSGKKRGTGPGDTNTSPEDDTLLD